MFTGLIEHKGKVLSNDSQVLGKRLIISSFFEQRPAVGDSVAVNGVCLTCVTASADQLEFDLSPETLAITQLGQLGVGDEVNLERALSAQSRLGGHYVSGHVDTTACLKRLTPLDEYLEIEVGEFAEDARCYLLSKASITLDGVSLTINRIDQTNIILMLVPHTVQRTTLGQCQVGHRFNVEFDYLTRIVAHQLKILAQSNSEVFS